MEERCEAGYWLSSRPPKAKLEESPYHSRVHWARQNNADLTIKTQYRGQSTYWLSIKPRSERYRKREKYSASYACESQWVGIGKGAEG